MKRDDKRLVSLVLAAAFTFYAVFATAAAEPPTIGEPVAPGANYGATGLGGKNSGYTPGRGYVAEGVSSGAITITANPFYGGAMESARPSYAASGAGTVTAAGTTLADSLTDIGGHKYMSAIYRCAQSGLVDSNGSTARPDQLITRGELAYTIERWFESNAGLLREVNAYYTERSGTFSDVSPSTAFYSEITAVARRGIMAGAGSFSPNASVSRQEAASIWTTVFSGLRDAAVSPSYISSLNVDNVLRPFTDRSSISSSYSRGAALMADQGYMRGYDGGAAFMPAKAMTRAEMYSLIDSFRIAPKGPSLSGVSAEWNVTPTYSFYPTASYSPGSSYYPYSSYNPNYPYYNGDLLTALSTRDWRYDGFGIDMRISEASYLSSAAYVKLYLTQNPNDTGYYNAFYGNGAGAVRLPALSTMERYPNTGNAAYGVTTYVYRVLVSAPGRWYVYAALTDYGVTSAFVSSQAYCDVNPSYSYPPSYSQPPSASASPSPSESASVPPSHPAEPSDSVSPSASVAAPASASVPASASAAPSPSK